MTYLGTKQRLFFKEADKTNQQTKQNNKKTKKKQKKTNNNNKKTKAGSILILKLISSISPSQFHPFI